MKKRRARIAASMSGCFREQAPTSSDREQLKARSRSIWRSGGPPSERRGELEVVVPAEIVSKNKKLGALWIATTCRRFLE